VLASPVERFDPGTYSGRETDRDDFKRVNDCDGHAAGDRLLVEPARAWTAALRPGTWPRASAATSSSC
jgi:predicted signal transduction protein with EAL and GGDEF domain